MQKKTTALFCLLLLTATLLSGCGFQPVHGRPSSLSPDGATASSIRDVKLLPLKDRIGQQLHNKLIDRMYLNGYPRTPTHTLEVLLTSNQRGLGIRKDAVATRAELTIHATMILRAAADRREIYRSNIRTRVSYNILDAQYATLVARENANQRALDQIADDVITRLGLFFTREADAPQTTSAPAE